MRISRRVYLVALTALLVTLSRSQPFTAAAGQAPSRTIVIAAGDDMKYSVTEITAKPGDVLKVRLMAVGTAPRSAMAHNFVLLKAGTNQLAFTEAAAKSAGTDYIPVSMRNAILAQTILIENGQSAEVTFTVPKTVGNYPFMCTFPGHFAAGARGKLIVKR